MMREIKAYHLHQSPFYCMTKKSRLAKLLQISLSELRQLSNNADYLYT